VLETQVRVPVTLGFLKGICRSCRGLPILAKPMASIHGRTSKIKRYYWREIAFAKFEEVSKKLAALGREESTLSSEERAHLHRAAGQDALDKVKELHATSPKYDYKERSQQEVIEACEVEIVRLDADFATNSSGKGVGVLDGADLVSAEEFVSRHYSREGWSAMFCESRPIHALFGVYMWLLIQSPTDSFCQVKGFGVRMDYPELSLKKGELLWTTLPSDFGTSGYSERRASEIEEHFESLFVPDRNELLWLFDYWVGESVQFRDYLWAHESEVVEKARSLVEILPPSSIIRILRYLIGDYWARYNGWPDLLLYKKEEFFFAEVKASRDGLSDDQKRWITNNHSGLLLPFKLVKIHRSNAPS